MQLLALFYTFPDSVTMKAKVKQDKFSALECKQRNNEEDCAKASGSGGLQQLRRLATLGIWQLVRLQRLH